MKKFIDITSSESIDLHKPIFENARKLHNDAILLATYKSSYSTATSLLILSLEELVKAVLVLLHSQGYRIYELEDSKKFFFDHKIRHQLIQIIEAGLGFFEVSNVWKNRRKNTLVNKKSSKTGLIIKGLLDIIVSAHPILNSQKRIEKLREFNTMKNNGFYVDYRDKLLTPIETVDKNDFNEVKLIEDRIIKFYKLLKLLFHPNIVNHLSKNEIDKLKEDLRFFTDDIMRDFSFKELKNI
ncbi:AbiV family abortive infection protein [Arenibacter sp. F20364]|uniref:AbiV family abortive infection protein n=1 Tax=Arenibacter sp. F20364 TaxID=2926415 RepID=UPI001FF58C53|nr:AbiV family abortive infection protein [Arenibacter sp. F20364]MCK0190452.1 AbiV family abortive infection protein [Arenibacter sp. F20364]